ncbi:hypothetical protein VPHD281_0005 [Vibrio phage D281]
MSTTDLAQQVADLTTATTELTEEVVGQKARLTAAADTATSKASEAQQHANSAAAYESAAGVKAGEANTSALAAEASKNEASQITGLDTVEQAVDLAMSETLGLMTETEARAIQKQNEEKYAASGMVHMGKHKSSGTAINEGMYLEPTIPNTIGMGRLRASDKEGTSKTDLAVTHIAGAISNLLGVSEYSADNGLYFKLPEAPDGTVIYDSTGDARGSGKANLDLKVDVDPKYGDVPTGTADQIRNEAVARAHEGEIRNGDFRLGDNGDWVKGGPDSVTITTQGVVVNGTQSVLTSVHQSKSKTIGSKYVIEMTIAEVVSGGVRMLFDNSNIPITYHTEAGKYSATVEVTADGVAVWGLRYNQDFVGTVSNVSIKPVTEEVVTHPVDLAMFEYYEEELTGRQEIFECIQSLSTTFGDTDVPTVLSTRPLSYFQQYDGQFADPTLQNDQYRCVVWSDLTDEQKRKVAAYMGEKLFVGENGFIVNGRLRARTFRGAGNGDWDNTDSTITGKVGLRFKSSTNEGMARPQGVNDSTPTFNDTGYAHSYVCPDHDYSSDKSVKGVFVPRNTNVSYPESVGYKAPCFAYVVATVPRANQGAYVKGLNEYGTALCSDGKKWYESTSKPTTLKDCFIGQIGGDIASGKSGHPDGIFYDGIEAGGLNGVIDWRLGAVANDSPEEAAKVEAKVESGTYRGLEKLVKSRATIQNRASYTGAFQNIDISKSLNAKVGDSIWVTNGSDWFIRVISDIRTAEDATNDVQVFWRDVVSGGSRTKGDAAMLVQETNLSVSGEFSTQMVIGDPANLLLIDVLKNGWLGTWCPVIPDDTSKLYTLTRKALGTTGMSHIYTRDNGATWTNGSFVGNFDSVLNGRDNWSATTGEISLINYKAFAKQTKPSTNKPVYNGKEGLMGVWMCSRYNADNGSLLGESLIGKVFTNSNQPAVGTSALTWSSFLTDGSGKLNLNSGRMPKHFDLNLAAPDNNSPAVKALPYQISDNGQCSIGIQANELTWDATAGDWGDDSAMKITADGSDTFVDLNGNTNLSVVHELALPIGWTHNHARVGTQVEGVDL